MANWRVPRPSFPVRRAVCGAADQEGLYCIVIAGQVCGRGFHLLLRRRGDHVVYAQDNPDTRVC